MDDLNRSTAPDIEANRADRQTARDDARRADSLRRADDRRDELRDDDAADEIGEAVGGISGVLTGAALGSLGGPIGTIIGGIAGAVSGWWAGRAIAEAASHVTTHDEEYYRTHYERSGARLADRSYEEVRPAYQLGHLAARNPDYANRGFEEVEPELQRGWSNDVSARHGAWSQVRDYARHAFDRGRSGFGTGAVAGSASTSSHEFDPVADSPAGGVGYGASAGGPTRTPNVSGGATGSASLGGPEHDTSAAAPSATASGAPAVPGATGESASFDRTRDVGEHLRDRASDALDSTKNAAERLGHRAANAADDLKDRVDGNPASKPGPDATDRPGRLS
jgi:hypothetical protein